MNPLRLFDYCYYTIAFIHKDIYVLEHQKEFAGILFLSVFQCTNILTILALLFPMEFNYFFYDYLIFGYIGLVIYNYIRYKRITSYIKFHERWKNEKYILRTLYKSFVFLYIIITFVLYVIATY